MLQEQSQEVSISELLHLFLYATQFYCENIKNNKTEGVWGEGMLKFQIDWCITDETSLDCHSKTVVQSNKLKRKRFFILFRQPQTPPIGYLTIFCILRGTVTAILVKVPKRFTKNLV